MVVQVLDREELDELLQKKWADMKAALSGGNVPGAMALFSEQSRSAYEYNFNLLRDHLAEAVAAMGDVTLVKVTDDLAEYNMEADQDGINYSFYLVFEKDGYGIWRIKFF